MSATKLNRSKKKFQHGSIVRLYLRDFMQYTEMEVKPGPTLNVIIGPNGSGKSSVVNGLALALGKIKIDISGLDIVVINSYVYSFTTFSNYGINN